MGAHRVLCGNALEAASCDALMGREKAQLIFTDPPYNVPIDGHVSGLGKQVHREFVMASGEMSPSAFTTFLQTAFERLRQYSVDGSIHYVCMDWRHLAEILAAGQGSWNWTRLMWMCPSSGGKLIRATTLFTPKLASASRTYAWHANSAL